MYPKEKNQKKYQQKLDKKPEAIDGVSECCDLLSGGIHEDEEFFNIKSKTLTLNVLISGLEIGFTYFFLLCTLYELLTGTYEETTIFKMFSFVYPVGFIFVILGKSALFTEQTSVLTLPVLNGQQSIWDLLRIWALVILGNVVGGILFTLFIGLLGPSLELFTHKTMVSIGTHVAHQEGWVLFLSAIVAGWLMGLLNWLLNSTTNSITRIFLIFIATALLVLEDFTIVLWVILRFLVLIYTRMLSLY